MLIRKQKGMLAAICLLILVMLGVSGYRYESERTPEYAVKALMEGITNRDEAKIARYADLDAIAASTYDESTAIMARDIEKLHETYPDDWFFRHDTAFMTQYIANRREHDLELIRHAWTMLMKNETDGTAEDEDAAYCAREAKEILPHYTAKLLSVTPSADGRQAYARVEITGDQTTYGQLVPKMQLNLAMDRQDDGHYRVTHIANIEKNFATVVKGIEDYCTLKGIQ